MINSNNDSNSNNDHSNDNSDNHIINNDNVIQTTPKNPVEFIF